MANVYTKLYTKLCTCLYICNIASMKIENLAFPSNDK